MKFRADFVTNSSSSSFIVTTNDSLDSVNEYISGLNKKIRALMVEEGFEELARGADPVMAYVPKKMEKLRSIYNNYCWEPEKYTLKTFKAYNLCVGKREPVSKKRVIWNHYYGYYSDYLKTRGLSKLEHKALNKIWIFGGENKVPGEYIDAIIDKYNAIYRHLG